MRARHLLHRCTYVLVRNAADEILVHRRTDTKDIHPGAYDVFAGGVCAAGESYDDCARREVAEELGVVGAELRFLFRHRYRGAHGQAWGAVYEACWDRPVRHQESEVAWATGWRPRGSSRCSTSFHSVPIPARSSRASARSVPDPAVLTEA